MVAALCWVDATVKFRDTPQGARQREVLRALEKDAGRKRAFIVADLTTDIEVGHDQYRRYLRGDTPLQWSHFSAFAKAFKVTTSELTRALGLMDDEVDPGLMDRVLDALRPLGVLALRLVHRSALPGFRAERLNPDLVTDSLPSTGTLRVLRLDLAAVGAIAGGALGAWWAGRAALHPRGAHRARIQEPATRCHHPPPTVVSTTYVGFIMSFTVGGFHQICRIAQIVWLLPALVRRSPAAMTAEQNAQT